MPSCRNECNKQCFLSRFWVSKWHPKILQSHPKIWKPRYGFALYWSKTIWGGKHVFLHVAVAADGFNVIGRHNFLVQKLEAEIVTYNLWVWYLCIAMRTTLLRPLTILPQICTLCCAKLRKHFNAVMEVFSCFTIRSTCLVMQQTAMKIKGRQLQACSAHAKQGCRVRAGSEILAIWAALKQLLENKNAAMCVASLRLIKTKKINMVLSFCQHWHLTWQNWAKFFRRYVLTLLRWNFRRTVHQ